jgi:hypothetical protein
MTTAARKPKKAAVKKAAAVKKTAAKKSAPAKGTANNPLRTSCGVREASSIGIAGFRYREIWSGG